MKSHDEGVTIRNETIRFGDDFQWYVDPAKLLLEDSWQNERRTLHEVSFDLNQMASSQLLIVSGRHPSALYKIQKIFNDDLSKFRLRIWGGQKKGIGYLSNEVPVEKSRKLVVANSKEDLEQNGVFLSQNKFPYFDIDTKTMMPSKSFLRQCTSEGGALNDFWYDANHKIFTVDHFETRKLGIANQIRDLFAR